MRSHSSNTRPVTGSSPSSAHASSLICVTRNRVSTYSATVTLATFTLPVSSHSGRSSATWEPLPTGAPVSSHTYMSEYLDEDPYLPTAYFADNDIIASSCIRALEDHGYSVPEDISVVGFDDVSTSALVNPPLTTMAVPKTNMGGLAVRRLVDLIQGNTGGEVVRISVQPEIVPRKSVAPPPSE